MMGLGRYVPKNYTSLKTGKNSIIEYKSKVHKIEHMISEIKDTGIDTKSYEEMLRRIRLDMEHENSQVDGNNNYSTGVVIGVDYSKAILELNEIEKALSQFDIYAKAVATCRYVISKVNIDSNLEEIKYYANLIVMTLKNIKDIDTNYLKNGEKIISEIYEIAYNVIKLEIMITGMSDIYEYAKISETDIYFFDKYIKDEISFINLDDENFKKVKSKLYDIKRNGIKTSYFDLELIKLLIRYNNDNYKEAVIKKINLLESKIYEQVVSLIQEFEGIDKSFEKINESKKVNRTKMQNAISRILSLLISASLFTFCGYGIARGIKKACSYPVYNKIVSQYSELTNSWDISENEVLISSWDDTSEKIYVYEYGSWYNDGKKTIRTVKKYDLSQITLDSIYEYLEYDVFKGEFISDNVFYYDENELEKYNLEFKGIEHIEYVDLEKEEASSEWILYTVLLEILYIMITILIYATCTESDYNRSFKVIFNNLKEDFKKLYENGKIITEEHRKIKKTLKELLDIVYENDELRMEFNKLFEENKHLLNDPDELMKRINNIEGIETIERIKTLSKKK